METFWLMEANCRGQHGWLEELDITPGMRVLEIGTDTGYNAALLTYRAGAENTVTPDGQHVQLLD